MPAVTEKMRKLSDCRQRGAWLGAAASGNTRGSVYSTPGGRRRRAEEEKGRGARMGWLGVDGYRGLSN